MTVRQAIILYQRDTRLLVCRLSPPVFDSFPLLSLTAANAQVSKNYFPLLTGAIVRKLMSVIGRNSHFQGVVRTIHNPCLDMQAPHQ